MASVGLGSPLNDQTIQKKRGRTLIVKTVKENLRQNLVEANDDFVILAWGKREPRKLERTFKNF
jgi:hypothetical protein